MSHAKNMVFKLATGDILCGLDADNFTGPAFAAYINKLFAKDKNIFLAQQELVDCNGMVYYRLGPGRLHNQLLMGRACFMGKMKLLENKRRRTVINQEGFGQGAVTVYSSGRELVL